MHAPAVFVFCEVLDVKRMQSSNAGGNGSERFRLVVSDGEHYQQAMLATQLNPVRLCPKIRFCSEPCPDMSIICRHDLASSSLRLAADQRRPARAAQCHPTLRVHRQRGAIEEVRESARAVFRMRISQSSSGCTVPHQLQPPRGTWTHSPKITHSCNNAMLRCVGGGRSDAHPSVGLVDH